MVQAVEDAYQWKTTRGLEIVKTAILSIEYDEDTKELMKDVKKADALSGARGNAFMQQAAARGMQAAGGMMNSMQQQPTTSSYQPSFATSQPVQPQTSQQVDPTAKLLEMKKLLDAGAITQEDYDAVKRQLLGL